jgi:hypothetical protein
VGGEKFSALWEIMMEKKIDKIRTALFVSARRLQEQTPRMKCPANFLFHNIFNHFKFYNINIIPFLCLQCSRIFRSYGLIHKIQYQKHNINISLSLNVNC